MVGTRYNTVVDVIMHQCPLCRRHSAFDGVQLCGQNDARSPFLDHDDNLPQMAFGAVQPDRDGGVVCMDMKF